MASCHRETVGIKTIVILWKTVFRQNLV